MLGPTGPRRAGIIASGYMMYVAARPLPSETEHDLLRVGYRRPHTPSVHARTRSCICQVWLSRLIRRRANASEMVQSSRRDSPSCLPPCGIHRRSCDLHSHHPDVLRSLAHKSRQGDRSAAILLSWCIDEVLHLPQAQPIAQNAAAWDSGGQHTGNSPSRCVLRLRAYAGRRSVFHFMCYVEGLV